jgi:hypothetical protein|tara:strand:+ start:680 stop:901 length:222 start_codon:yes stop_codon:yes gene_type:complete
MNQTRKNWLLVLVLAFLAALIFFCTMAIFRAGGVIKVFALIFDIAWLWVAYEAILALSKKKSKNKKKSETNKN